MASWCVAPEDRNRRDESLPTLERRRNDSDGERDICLQTITQRNKSDKIFQEIPHLFLTVSFVNIASFEGKVDLLA
jgi:hypothetical protein